MRRECRTRPSGFPFPVKIVSPRGPNPAGGSRTPTSAPTATAVYGQHHGMYPMQDTFRIKHFFFSTAHPLAIATLAAILTGCGGGGYGGTSSGARCGGGGGNVGGRGRSVG